MLTTRTEIVERTGVREGYYRPDLAMKLAVLTLDARKLYPELYMETLLAQRARSQRISKVV